MSIKMLHIDIETQPSMVYTWGLFNQNISIKHIAKPGSTICFAAKWEGSKNSDIIFRSEHEHGHEEMVKKAHELVDEADVLVHYNGLGFDHPTLNKEFLLQGLKPPSPVRHVDLLRTAKKQFKFQSNKLDFIVQALGIGAKTEHKGIDLWRQCMEGDEKAWKLMKRYNINDVIILQKLYHVLKPWIPLHPNHALYTESAKPVCMNCGSTHLQYRGYAHTHTMTYRKLQCQSCGKWQRERTNCLPKEKKSVILNHITE